MLVTARIVGFILLFVIVIAYFNQGEDNAAGGSNIGVLETKVLVKGTQTTIENKIRGRKVAFRRDNILKQTFVRAKDTKKPRILISRENYGARFVAFNADYKGPRHHPPKNN